MFAVSLVRFRKKRDSKEKGKEYGASWIGQVDVVSRIVLGFDGRINNLKFIIQKKKPNPAITPVLNIR
jgi:hypothetical protein